MLTLTLRYVWHQAAILFGDYKAATEILGTGSYLHIRALARTINIDHDKWQKHRIGVTYTGYLYTFRQSEGLTLALLGTRDRDIIFLSTDCEQGAGVTSTEEFIKHGQHLVYKNEEGQILMKVRETLRKEIKRV